MLATFIGMVALFTFFSASVLQERFGVSSDSVLGLVALGFLGLAIAFPISCVLVAVYYSLREGMAHKHGENPICWKCGYDLTGNVSGVCPECGASVPPVEAKDRNVYVDSARSRVASIVGLGIVVLVVGLLVSCPQYWW